MSTLNINKSTYNIYKYTALLSFAVIMLLGVAFLQPTSFNENANAETASLDTSVTLEPAITIWTTDTNNNTSSQVNIAADPDESVATGTIRAHVSTNNLTGYTLTIQSNSTDAKMVHENESITKTINPITGSGTSASSWKSNSSLNNMWGYSIGTNDSFIGVPGSSSDATTIDETDAPNNDNYTDVTFAAKADLSLPAGTYTDTVIFSAVANALPETRTLDDFEYMQDIDTDGTSAAICENSTEWTTDNNKEYTLKDSRDNISYKIRKLKDGHCWMAQNLRLTADTLSANSSRTANPKTTLTSDDTDINGPTASFAMPSNASWSASNASAGKLTKGAADASKLPVGPSKITLTDQTTITARGAYYSWCTATADCTNDVSAGIHQENSICPKSWHLANPNNGSSDDNNEYYKVYKVYNLYGSAASFNKAFNTYYDNGASYYLAGYYNPNSSYQYVRNPGTYGRWWSSTAHSSNADVAWGLDAGTSSVDPQGVSNRYNGNSVRCML